MREQVFTLFKGEVAASGREAGLTLATREYVKVCASAEQAFRAARADAQDRLLVSRPEYRQQMRQLRTETTDGGRSAVLVEHLIRRPLPDGGKTFDAVGPAYLVVSEGLEGA